MQRLSRVVVSLLLAAGALVAVASAGDGQAKRETEREVVVVPLDAAANGGVRARRAYNGAATNAWPAAVAPACRAFEAKCQEKTATRGDLIALKRFIAASAIDAEAKTNATKRIRKIYQESRKR